MSNSYHFVPKWHFKRWVQIHLQRYFWVHSSWAVLLIFWNVRQLVWGKWKQISFLNIIIHVRTGLWFGFSKHPVKKITYLFVCNGFLIQKKKKMKTLVKQESTILITLYWEFYLRSIFISSHFGFSNCFKWVKTFIIM